MTVTETPCPVSRREIVVRCLKWLAAGGFLAIAWKFIRGIPAMPSVVVFKRKPETGEVISNDGAYLIGSERGVIALSDRCPHLGCRVNYTPKAPGFQCPCHGSRFAPDGGWLKGPAGKNMAVLELRLDEKSGTYTTHIPISGSID